MSTVYANDAVNKELGCGENISWCVGLSLVIHYISADDESYTVRIFFFWSKCFIDVKVGLFLVLW